MLTTGFIVLGVGVLLFLVAVAIHSFAMKQMFSDSGPPSMLFLGPLIGAVGQVGVLVGIIIIIVALVTMYI